jgi:transcriptional antiterminator RfaH
MHWHLVYTKPKQEECALKNLEQQGYTSYLPMIPFEKLCNGTLNIAYKPLFPRYIFIHLNENNQTKGLSPINSTRGVSKLVSFGMGPAKINNALITSIMQQEAQAQAHPNRIFNQGDHVQVINGSLKGIEGIYHMTNSQSRIMVLIELLSKTVSIHIPPSNLKKIAH